MRRTPKLLLIARDLHVSRRGVFYPGSCSMPRHKPTRPAAECIIPYEHSEAPCSVGRGRQRIAAISAA